MTITKGQKFRWIGRGDSEFYTRGQVYEVTCERVEDSPYFQMTDDTNSVPHHWQDDADFRANFERVDSPVRTVTRKEIVPGTYGIVNVAVAPGYAATWIENRFYSPAEIRAAAATLIEIADALGDTK